MITLKDRMIILALSQLAELKYRTDVIGEHILSTNEESTIRTGDFECPLVNMNPARVHGEDLMIVTASAKEVRRQVKQVEDDLLKILPGWVHFGGKHEIPHEACYVGRYGDLYAWVLPDGVAPLSVLTLKVINFSSLIKDSSIVTIPGGGPRYTPSAAPSVR